MPYRPTRRQNTFPGTTPYRRRPSVEGARRARPLFARSRVARAGNVLARCKAALACFGAAALVLALALALPLTTSPSAAADVDLEARAAAEAARAKGVTSLHCNTEDEVVGYVRQNVRPGDALLAKASHAMKLDDVLARFYQTL